MCKFALLLTGYNSSVGKVNRESLNTSTRCLKYSFETFNKCLLSENDIDVYIHTWESDNNDLYEKLFEPKNMKIEKQPDFSDAVGNIKLFRTPDYKQAMYAKAYSVAEGMKLIDKEQYDGVMITRPDISWYHTTDLSVLDPQYFHTTKFIRWYYRGRIRVYPKDVMNLNISPQSIKSEVHDKIHDLVYFSSYKNVFLFSSLFEKLQIYFDESNKIRFIGSKHRWYDVHYLHEQHLKYIDLYDKVKPSFDLLSQVFTTRNTIEL